MNETVCLKKWYKCVSRRIYDCLDKPLMLRGINWGWFVNGWQPSYVCVRMWYEPIQLIYYSCLRAFHLFIEKQVRPRSARVEEMLTFINVPVLMRLMTLVWWKNSINNNCYYLVWVLWSSSYLKSGVSAFIWSNWFIVTNNVCISTLLIFSSCFVVSLFSSSLWKPIKYSWIQIGFGSMPKHLKCDILIFDLFSTAYDWW